MTGVAVAVGILLDSAWLASRPHLQTRCAVGVLMAVAAFGMACVERQKVWANTVAIAAAVSHTSATHATTRTVVASSGAATAIAIATTSHTAVSAITRAWATSSLSCLTGMS